MELFLLESRNALLDRTQVVGVATGTLHKGCMMLALVASLSRLMLSAVAGPAFNASVESVRDQPGKDCGYTIADLK